jgi:hypothetical protein
VTSKRGNKMPTKTIKGQTLKLSSRKPQAFVCYHCSFKIKEGEKYVIVGTYLGIKKRETFSEYFYHLNCWQEFFNQAVKKRLDEAKKQAFDVIEQSPMFNIVKGLLPNQKQEVEV